MRELNKHQTPITEALLDSLIPEVQEQLFECINNIPFIQNLISPNRQYAKDRPRDSEGKIIVDLTNPHIVENPDYFRQSAIHFQKYKCYTFLKPNMNPNSEFKKWLDEEVRRCWEGYVRESDGEWVTGYMYFYLNYSPIMLSKIREGTKHADRVYDFPEFWEGIYWRFHYIHQAYHGGLYNDWKGGNHGAELASRGKGKSFSLASILTHNFIVGSHSKKTSENTNSIVTAYQKEYLTKDGVLNKFVTNIDFLAEHTQFPRKRLQSSFQHMTWKMGYKDAELDIEKGTKNTVIGVSSKDDESKIRGKRAIFIGIEEFGSFARLIDTYNVLIPSVQEGDVLFGQLFLQGTAGDSESDFAGATEIMYSPTGYNMYALPNVYDKTNQGKPQFVFFFGGYINRKGCYDEDGVSDVIAALIEILNTRYRVKYNSTDPNTILKTIAEVPITPAEAIIKTGVNIFPVMDLTARMLQLEADPKILQENYNANLILNSNREISYVPSSNSAIHEFPYKSNDLEGAVTIMEMPERDKEGKVFTERYILGCDPFDVDTTAGSGMSLGSVFVLDLWKDRIVAEYTGRPAMTEDFFEIVRRLCIFYNGKLNYENNKKGLFAYFSTKHSLHLLTDTLEFLRDKQLVKSPGFGNTSKGTNATLAVNNYAKTLIRNWLISSIPVVKEVDGQEVEEEVSNLYFLKSKPLIQELLAYNSEGNFDRISALGMLMLLREDKMINVSGDRSVFRNDDKKKNYMGNDDFFKTNYDNRVGFEKY